MAVLKYLIFFILRLISAVGACTHNIRELDSDVMNNSVVIVDSVESAMKEAGDILLAKVSSFTLTSGHNSYDYDY